MSFIIAAASSSGVSVDEHFGHAGSFYIYEVQSDGAYKLIGVNHPPGAEEQPGELRRTRSGCGGGGCHGGGCGGGGNIPNIDVGYLGGAKYVLAAKIGKGIEKALLKKKITPFAVETAIDEAIGKIVIYENRLNRFR